MGSFLNSLSYRLPYQLNYLEEHKDFSQLNIAEPRSFCPNCSHALSYYSLVPIFSYLMQRGKCLSCDKKISLEYPFYELLTGSLFLFSFLLKGFIVTDLFIIFLVILISRIDYRFFKIPIFLNILVLSSSIVKAYLISNWSLLLLGFLISGVGLIIIKLVTDKIIKKESLGMGDILLISFVCSYFGPFSIPPILFISSFLGIIYIFLQKKIDFDKQIAFAPFISIATILYLFFLNQITI